MSTVRQHLGLLWLSRRVLMTSNPQYDKAWTEQAALFVGVHLNDLIELAGGADLEAWVLERASEIPADFPHRAPTTSTVSAPQPVDGVRWDLFPGYLIDHCEGDTISEEGLQHAVARMLKDTDYLRVCAEGAQAAPDSLEAEIVARRIAIFPENEGGFHAQEFGDQDTPIAKGYGETPSTAIRALRTTSTDQANADTGSAE